MQDELEKEREKVKTTFFLFPFSLRDTANADRPGSMGGDEREDLYGDCVRIRTKDSGGIFFLARGFVLGYVQKMEIAMG